VHEDLGLRAWSGAGLDHLRQPTVAADHGNVVLVDVPAALDAAG
jgi:hypothetical protein